MRTSARRASARGCRRDRVPAPSRPHRNDRAGCRAPLARDRCAPGAGDAALRGLRRRELAQVHPAGARSGRRRPHADRAGRLVHRGTARGDLRAGLPGLRAGLRVASRRSYVRPHRDWPASAPRYTRIHVPLQTDERGLNSEDDEVFHMGAGEIWLVDPSRPHSGGCFSDGTRVHLVLDSIPAFRCPTCSATARRSHRPPFVTLSSESRSANATSKRSTGWRGSPDRAELHADRRRPRHDTLRKQVGCAAMYDWLAEIAARSGNGALVGKAAGVDEPLPAPVRARLMAEVTRLWLYPPLAFARLGNADTPLDSFHWGPNDDTPRGTGTTSIRPAETLSIRPERDRVLVASDAPVPFRTTSGCGPSARSESSTASGATPPERIAARLHARHRRPGPASLAGGAWPTTSRSTLTPERAENEPRRPLRSTSRRMGGPPSSSRPVAARAGAAAPPVPPDRPRSARLRALDAPQRSIPGISAALHAGPGEVLRAGGYPESWKAHIPPEQLFLNGASTWCGWKSVPSRPARRSQRQDTRKTPTGRAWASSTTLCNGIVTCTIEGTNLAPAVARIVVGPPYAREIRRPPVSLADGCKDRVDRAEKVRNPGYVAEQPALVFGEVQDLLERAFETGGQHERRRARQPVVRRTGNPWMARQRNIPYDPANQLEPILASAPAIRCR